MRTYISLTLAILILILSFLRLERPIFSPVPTPTPKPIILPTTQPGPTPTPMDPSREQYYRGIYDVCAYFGVREHPGRRKDVERACRVVIDRALKKDWYETPSPNWKWPLPKEGDSGA